MSSSAIKFAVNALNREKPRSSITEWIEILTSPSYADEAYDGIPEIVESINLQPTGTAEASRAIRKKIKHGNSHHQYRALVILTALVENGPRSFQTNFADGQLLDAIKHLASDSSTDAKVKKKVLSVLASWHNQFKGDAGMTTVSNLYRQCKPAERKSHQSPVDVIMSGSSNELAEYGRRQREKEEKEAAKKKAKEEVKARQRREEEEARRRKNRPKRARFNFETEKPQILTAIAGASQTSSNLVNAMMLVNAETDSVITNDRVQDCLVKAKTSRKAIVRYIQLVENEEMIGTLIETNERIIAALQMYDDLATPDTKPDPTVDITKALEGTNISSSELHKLQDRQRAAVQRVRQQRSQSTLDLQGAGDGSGHVHPDLQDLSFGSLGLDQHGLPAPMRPSSQHEPLGDAEWDRGRGSLSDFSDYDSDGDEHSSGSPSRHAGPSTSTSAGAGHGNKLVDVEDPFADPFAD
ncbi:hypothetical protein CONPUDRAFT_95934 [Coniophora puteana RWD-64-598 SS2]|uniref:VHS domain-containing protein n=1 Tax=Coniophora puteana (strain RWD-64-598) TaxID=741705 RepID=A0A5M3N6Q9_CONPW|nr:uncharacterized protein CONPUDRAFT_95934 [Coniophora puteana RWD-64-598 SS2]EIW86917.1 hypothetical protein CONPUDRAFT_95934 [Coniophora puteana RWD-64-598 SS2]